MNWRRLGDVGLWAGLSLLVLAESGARNDPYWVRAVCIAVLLVGVFFCRARPLLARSRRTSAPCCSASA